MRRPLLLPLILASSVLLIIVGVYFILRDFQQKSVSSGVDPFLWQPVNAEVVFHTRKPWLLTDGLAQVGNLGASLSDFFTGTKARDFFEMVDSVVKNDEMLYKTWQQTQLTIGLVSDNGIFPGSFVAQFTFPVNGDMKKISGYIQGAFLPDSTLKYLVKGEEKIILYSAAKMNGELSIIFRNNALIVSTSAALMGHPDIEMQKQSGILSDTRFNALCQMAGQFADNFFIRTSTLCRFIPDQLTQDYPLSIGCADVAGWQTWDISYNAESLFFNGFAQSEAYGERFIDNLKSQQKQESNFLHYIPPQPDLIAYLGLSETSSFFLDYREWLLLNRNDTTLSILNQRFEDITNLPADTIYPWWTGEIVWIKPDNEPSGDGVLLLSVDTTLNLAGNSKLADFFRPQPVNYEDEFVYAPEIERLNIPDFLKVLTRGLVVKELAFFHRMGQYWAFSAQPQSLVSYLEKLRFGKKFADSEPVKLMAEFMPSGQSMFFYVSAATTHSLAPDRLTGFSSSAGSSQKFTRRSFALQLLPSPGNVAFANALLMERRLYPSGNPIAWEYELKAPLQAGPYSVFNHNTREDELILQDQSHTLYLFDLDGKLLWSKELTGPIMSDIFQVDIFKNGRYQYLFNTRNFLHLIDRNGNYVRGYPLRLPSNASAGIAVFDYDRNKNYRILMPAENRRIYNFNLRGQAVVGWKLPQTSKQVTLPVQHFRLGTRDYLVAVDDDGQVRFFDREGAIRLRPIPEPVLKAGFPVFAHQPPAGKPFFIGVGDGGVVHQIFTDGTVNRFLPDSLHGDFSFGYFEFTRKGEKDLVFLNKGVVSAFSLIPRVLFSTPLQTEVSGKIKIVQAEKEEMLLSVTDKKLNRVFFVNTVGSVESPFSIEGDTPPVAGLSKNGDYWLVTSGNNVLRMFRFEKAIFE